MTPKQVFQLCYCDYYEPDCEEEWRAMCKDFVDSVTTAYPGLSRKQKIHLFIHVVDSIKAFGPTSSYCTKRYNTKPQTTTSMDTVPHTGVKHSMG